MIHLSHNSSMLAQSCWKKYYWNYVEKIKPKTKPISFEIGECIHAAFNMHYNGFERADVSKFIENYFTDLMATAGPQNAEDYVVAMFTVMGMWEAYPKSLSGFEEIKPELSFTVPLGDAEYIGRVDGLVKLNSKWWVREVKTTTLNQSHFERRSESSPQATGYVYAAQKLGYDVHGVVFDCIRKPLLRKFVTDTTESFGKRILNDYINRPDFYFSRHMTYRSSNDIKNFEDDMFNLVEDIKDKTQHPEKFYRNTHNCWNYNSECPYYKICFQKEVDQLTLDLYFKKGDEDNGKGTTKGNDGNVDGGNP